MTARNLSALLFRPAAPNDLHRIGSIIRDARERMRLRGSRQWQNGYPAAEDIGRDIARERGYVLCTPEGRIVAYGAVAFDGEAAYADIRGSWLDEEPYAVLHRLAVAGEALRQGVAAEFLRRSIRLTRGRGLRSFRADTNFDNAAMLRLFAALGFVRCGEIRYADGPRIAFQLRIPAE
ncbi:MAG: GNAT family N-acetyltransferase [Alistipes sp.]|nr:GNAT family N-acetyltransferase [Alistipes sp.]